MSARVPFLESKPWRKLRQLALARDHFRCTICGVDVSAPGAARVDHIKSRALRPDLALTLSNVRTLCPRCDNQSHAEKRLPLHMRSRDRVERITGSTSTGMPIDPKHHWYAKR